MRIIWEKWKNIFPKQCQKMETHTHFSYQCEDLCGCSPWFWIPCFLDQFHCFLEYTHIICLLLSFMFFFSIYFFITNVITDCTIWKLTFTMISYWNGNKKIEQHIFDRPCKVWVLGYKLVYKKAFPLQANKLYILDKTMKHQHCCSKFFGTSRQGKWSLHSELSSHQQ